MYVVHVGPSSPAVHNALFYLVNIENGRPSKKLQHIIESFIELARTTEEEKNDVIHRHLCAAWKEKEEIDEDRKLQK